MNKDGKRNKKWLFLVSWIYYDDNSKGIWEFEMIRIS